MNICLCNMTKELARRYFQDFAVDEALLLENQPYQPYIYSPEKAEDVVARYQQLGRVYLAVMLDDEPIGEIILKNIDTEQRHCTMGISLQRDIYKNKGYGTEAEIQALQFAFDRLNLETVYADSVIRNTRSQHVLEKVGFIETHRDKSFVYYRCDKINWTGTEKTV